MDGRFRLYRLRHTDAPVADSPNEWIKAYGNETAKRAMADAEQTDWYKKWYGK